MNTDERRAKKIVEEIATDISGMFGSQEVFKEIWLEFLRTDYRQGGNPKPYAIAVAFGLWYRQKIQRLKDEMDSQNKQTTI